MPLELRDAVYGDASTTPLDDEIQQEMVVRYGGPDDTLEEAAQLRPPSGVFVVASLAGDVVGCGGLREHSATEVELKRFYVRRSHRRRGLARQLLAALEERAAREGYRRIILETGTPQPEAIALYASSGYAPVPGFGKYAAFEESRYFGKDLPPLA